GARAEHAFEISFRHRAACRPSDTSPWRPLGSPVASEGPRVPVPPRSPRGARRYHGELPLGWRCDILLKTLLGGLPWLAKDPHPNPHTNEHETTNLPHQ